MDESGAGAELPAAESHYGNEHAQHQDVQPIRRRARERPAPRSKTLAASCAALTGAVISSRAAALLPLIAHKDLIAEVVPDLLVNGRKPGLESDLCYVARPGQIDLVI